MLKPGQYLGDEVDDRWDNSIHLEIWRKIHDEDGTYTGTVQRDRGRLMKDIFADLIEELKKYDGLWDEMDYFSLERELAEMEWPSDIRWIACYAVTGGSEGHYIHLSWIRQPSHSQYNQEQFFVIGKTFFGMDKAQEIANLCAKLLGA